MLTFVAAVGDAAGEVGRELVAQGHAAADPLLVHSV